MVLLYSSTPPVRGGCPAPSCFSCQVFLLLPLSVAAAAVAAAVATCLELLRQLLANDDNSINMLPGSTCLSLMFLFGFA